MKLEKDKCYIHKGGRKIQVVGEVMTDTWGEMWVIEESDKTGRSISCVEKTKSDIPDENWIEIGKPEWGRVA